MNAERWVPAGALEGQMFSFGYSAPIIIWWPMAYSGTNEGDWIAGQSITQNSLDGFGGDDVLFGNIGYDHLSGGNGDDSLYGRAGNDMLFGGDGRDWLQGDEGDDWLWGDDGNDTLLGGDGNDQMWGGNGNDHLEGGAGHDQLFGDAGDDWIYLGDGGSKADGGDGDDYIMGGSGFDTITGGNGNDEIHGGEGLNDLAGGGNDYITFGDGYDVVNCGAGNDTADFNLMQINSPFYVNGEAGYDTVAMDYMGGLASKFDFQLSWISQRVDSIERLDFNYLIPKIDFYLKPADILDFTETGDLKIDGNGNQTLHLGTNWQDNGITKGATVSYHDFTAADGNQLVHLHVDTAIHIEVA
jgi:Ca2+-binding RTX toxin-like protein